MPRCRGGLLLALLLAVAGCRGKPKHYDEPPIDAAPPPDDALADLRAEADRMCACKDLPCVDRVQRELAVRGHRYRDDAPLAPERAREVQVQAERLDNCAHGAARPDGGAAAR